jgi:3-phenylpropionate/trans-cinnamate dioxygenase ferredoxin reductase subunit
MHYRYVIVGGGTAATAAIEGIRAHDGQGSILLVSRENHLPYARSPLSKDVWREAYDLERLSLRPAAWYDENGVEVRLRREIVELDAEHHVLWDERGDTVGFDHALVCSGCRPRRLQAHGAETSGVRYYRDLEDYLDLERRLQRIQHVTVLGGNFTAVEMASSLRARGTEVTFIVPDEYPLHRMLPRELGEGLAEFLRHLDVELVTGDTIVLVDEMGEFLHARTLNGNDLTTQLVLVDLGGEAQVELAEAAGLATDDGIVVDEYGRTSQPGIWAAGDVAEFPYLALNQLMRVEGTDHAEHHGRCVGANMAGAQAPYTHLPVKWFAAGDMRFEGVGDLNARAETQVVWLEPGQEGVVFYVAEDVVRGVLLCNVPGRLDWARSLVREAKPTSPSDRAALLAARP